LTGNARPSGTGEVFRDHHGSILKTFAIFLGNNTNNVVELDSLMNGIHIENREAYGNVMVEGDS
jgi:ribonuclease HI